MKMSEEQTQWMLKVFQPERAVASLPGAASLTEQARAALLGLDPDYYSTELAKLSADAKASARMLLADPDVGTMIDRLPLRKDARSLRFWRQPDVGSTVLGGHPARVACGAAT